MKVEKGTGKIYLLGILLGIVTCIQIHRATLIKQKIKEIKRKIIDKTINGNFLHTYKSL